MSLFCIFILIVCVSVDALPSRYSERHNYGLEVDSLNEPVVAASASPKNSAGKTEESGYHKIFGTDAEGEKGFESGTFSHGENGYKELDTFHKQIGDKYGFEENLEFGHEEEAKENKSGGQKKKNDSDGAGTSFDAYYGNTGSGEYSGGDVDGDGGNYNQEYSTGNSGEGAYSSFSQNYNVGDAASSGEYDY